MTTESQSLPQAFLWDPKAGLSRTAAPIPPEGRGVILHDRFHKGSYAVSSIATNDQRFIEAVGFTRSELMHEDSFYGYYQTSEKSRPRPIRMFIDELMARAVGMTVHSPRGQPDRIATMEWTEFGKDARALLLYKDGQLLLEERGAGDLMPELTATEERCVRDKAIHFTSVSRRKDANFIGKGREQQTSLLTPSSLDDDLLISRQAAQSSPEMTI